MFGSGNIINILLVAVGCLDELSLQKQEIFEELRIYELKAITTEEDSCCRSSQLQHFQQKYSRISAGPVTDVEHRSDGKVYGYKLL